MASGRLLRGLAGGGSGSGFIIQHGDKFYILTNEHVVRHADSVVLEFETDTGRREFRSIVLARNSDLDLALVKLPAEKEVTRTFAFLDGPTPRDGTEVWSAGFPALPGTGLVLWQLGSGIISNRNVTQIFGERLSHVIQHTAQTDGGNSGGPLLVRNTNSKVGYDVIGVNTWSARHREGTNFSVPAAEVMRFLDSIKIQQTVVLDQARAIERMNAFASIVNSRTTSYKNILPFVSMDYVLSIPAESFISFLRSASDSARIAAGGYFRNVEPFEAFRIIIADAIWQRRNRPLSFENIVATDLTEPIKGNFLDNRGRPVTSEWRYENGDFFMVDFGGLSVRARRDAALSDYNPGRGSSVSTTFPISDWQEVNHQYSWSWFFNRHFGLAQAVWLSSVHIPEREDAATGDTLRARQERTFGVAPIIPFAQYPISLGRFHVIPYVQVPLSLNLGELATLSAAVDIGARFGLMTSRNNRFWYLGVFYRMNSHWPAFAFLSSGEERWNFRTHSFGITLGFQR